MAKVRDPLGKPGYALGGSLLFVVLANVSSGKIALPLGARGSRELVALEVCVSWPWPCRGTNPRKRYCVGGTGSEGLAPGSSLPRLSLSGMSLGA